ncbi:hypothetical protein [Candidatus Igneacidithiobacillus taiwanensis]|uniref:hypothetical protein n=1 Tax=Candidatus Igneacidithiobacillus taiwanensis TaxID=1945924 RepID=UPI0028A0254D|nr:hypothetical protein [Candidatus Igneacidithiobacillus taiwanensis]MCE5360310.1 hypothetical protein [Acidithiobacillus sp.]
MQELCQFFDRRIYHVEGGEETPAVYYIADEDAGGILVNAPLHCEETWQQLASLAPPTVLFLPSRFGAQDLVSWRERGLRLVAQPAEGKALGVELDVALDSKLRLTRTIDFLPMSGRTAGSCALRLRNKPGAIFFGPILEPAAPDAWPTLLPHPDDQSWENRLFGSLGLQDVSFAYAFCDRFFPGRTPIGPGADAGIAAALHELWADD